MQIVNWVDLIREFQNSATPENITELIKNDFNTIRDGVFEGERVIIRIAEGFRAEVEFSYEIGHFDMKKITNDFNIIRKYNQMEEKLHETVEEIKEILKDNNEALDRLDEYINEQTQFPLFNITFYHKTKIFKAISGIPYDFAETYLERALENFGIYINPVETETQTKTEPD
jgi:uncharacterized protein YjgD (DUF1641 family)